MRRLAAAATLLAACLAGAAQSHAATEQAYSWAAAEIAVVTERGIFGGTAETFRPDDPLTRQSLERVVARLTGRPERKVANGAAPVTLARLDAALVRAVGLGPAAGRILAGARAAGLRPPQRFGTEAVARLIGLRLNHEQGAEDLELQPHEPATRAETAYSVARILGFSAAVETRRPTGASRIDYSRVPELESVRELSRAFELPALTDPQRSVLATAASYIGFPYVWGGTGAAARGFDCSGFVWRVFKLTPYAGAEQLAGVVGGRTTMDMSAEGASRFGTDELEPGDLLFFGKRGPYSKPAQVDHAGIYLGGGWMIHSSRYGVALVPLDGWWGNAFAWARRPLAEAGLA